MSLYSECSEALTRLMENPPEDSGGVFSEIDVVNEAAKEGWSTNNYKEAQRYANQVVGTQYRAMKLTRYGPVELPDGNLDYGRIASKIAVASAENGPKVWKTPNGEFPRMMVQDDNLSHQGRRTGTNRNDLAPWDDQQIVTAKIDTNGGPPVYHKPLLKRISDLEKTLREKDQRIAKLIAEARVGNGTGTMSRAEIEELVTSIVDDRQDDIEGRVLALENREKAREKMYAS